MAKLTAQQFARKYVERTGAATEAVRQGIEGVTESPTVKAAKQQQKMLTKLTAAVNSGLWGRRLNAVTLEDWKKAALEKGLPRIAAGVQAAEGKMTEFASQLLPAIDSAVSKVKSLPSLTLEDNINRATTMIREMSKFKFNK